MLRKLLKYEFRSVSRTLIPILLGTLALAILTAALFTINFRMLDSQTEIITTEGTEVVVKSGFANGVIGVILIILLLLFSIAIIAAVFVVWFILMQRYYKNFFGDEGYLTFTLPVKTSQHLTTKLISGVVWIGLGVITVMLSIFILVAFGTAESGQIVNTRLLSDIGNVISELYSYVGTGNGIAYTIELIVLMLVEFITQTLLFYLAITVGSIIAKKHKILASAGVYLGINAVVAALASVSSMIVFGDPDYAAMSNTEVIENMGHTFFILFIVFYLVTGIISYVICDQLLKKKLNLE